MYGFVMALLHVLAGHFPKIPPHPIILVLLLGDGLSELFYKSLNFLVVYVPPSSSKIAQASISENNSAITLGSPVGILVVYM